jgi:hypothetical protein
MCTCGPIPLKKACLVGIEACASSHHWSRELQALGHTVRLMPPAYVKPYVKRQKNDSTDAEAICEAVTRPNMRFVPTKTVEQQSCLMLHRARHLFIRQQTAVINSIRAYLAEFGIVAPVGRRGVEQLLEVVADTADHRLPEVARAPMRSFSVNSTLAASERHDRCIPGGLNRSTVLHKRFAKVSEETSDGPESRWIEPDAGISRRRRHRGPGSGNEGFQPRAIVAQRPRPLRMTDHATKPRDILRKPRFAISTPIEIHPALRVPSSLALTFAVSDAAERSTRR